MYGIIYRAYIEDGRSYIGQTVKKLQRRINEHKCNSKKPKFHFHNAIAKYGIDTFKWEVLQECESLEELNNAEVYWINKFNSIENGFNHREGGFNSKMCEDTRLKLSEDRKGAGNPMFGKSSAVRGKGNLYAENIPTKFKKGNIPWNKGIKSNVTIKLDFEKAEKIRELYNSGILIKNICQEFEIKPNTVYDIIANRIWKKDPKEIKEKIMENLIKGIRPKKVAEILNISLSYVYFINRGSK